MNLQENWIMLSRVKEEFLAIPDKARLPGMNRPMLDIEKLCVAYFNAALLHLGSKGVDVSKFKVTFDEEPHFQPIGE